MINCGLMLIGSVLGELSEAKGEWEEKDKGGHW